MAFKFNKNNKNNASRIAKDERIVDQPEGKGLLKRSGKMDNILMNRTGLINGPLASKQEPDPKFKKKAKKRDTKASKLGSILKR